MRGINETADKSGRAVYVMGFRLLDTVIVRSNPAQRMDVCLRFSVYVESLCRSECPSKESYQMSNGLMMSEVFISWNRSQVLILKH
jgi:hypothetical protein